MQYMLLIYDDEKMWGKLSEKERGTIFGEYGQFTDGIVKGVTKAGEALAAHFPRTGRDVNELADEISED